MTYVFGWEEGVEKRDGRQGDDVPKVGANVRATTTQFVPRSIIAYAFGRINSDQLQASAIAITALTITS